MTGEPVDFLETLHGDLDEVLDLGEEDVRGVPATHYRVLLEYHNGTPRASGLLGIPGGPFDVWVDGQGRPIRLEFSSAFDGAFGGGNPLLADVVIEFFDYGVPVDIQAPPADQIYDEDAPGSSGYEFTEQDIFDAYNPPCYGDDTDSCRFVGEELRAAYTNPGACDGNTKRICFLPIGNMPAEQIEFLGAYFLGTYGLEIAVLPAIDASEIVGTQVTEKQWKLSMDLFEAFMFLEHAEKIRAGARIIAISPVDMFGRGGDGSSFVFGSKVFEGSTGEPLFGLVSTFRMNPVTQGESPNDDVWRNRIRVMVTKYVGINYYGLEEDFDDEASAMYRHFYSLRTLDGVRKDLEVPFGAPPADTIVDGYILNAVAGAPCWGENLMGCFVGLPETAEPNADRSDCYGEGRRVCIVPMGNVPKWQIDAVVSAMSEISDIEVHVAPAVGILVPAVDQDLGRISSTQAIRELITRYPDLNADEDLILIELLPIDLGDRFNWKPEFSRVFTSTKTGLRRYAIISTFRLNPLTYGEPEDNDLWGERIVKLAVRGIALTYSYIPEFPESTDPLSITYNGMRTLEDIDYMRLPIYLGSFVP